MTPTKRWILWQSCQRRWAQDSKDTCPRCGYVRHLPMSHTPESLFWNLTGHPLAAINYLA